MTNDLIEAILLTAVDLRRKGGSERQRLQASAERESLQLSEVGRVHEARTVGRTKG